MVVRKHRISSANGKKGGKQKPKPTHNHKPRKKKKGLFDW